MALGEFAFIGRFLRPLAAASPDALDLRDDAAVIEGLGVGRSLVATADAMVEGVHFLPGDPPGSVAQKLLRVNLSDLAAMGAEPLGWLLALARPAAIDDDWLASFAEGLATDQIAFDFPVLGGDTVSTPGPLTLALTALGRVPAGQALRRSGGNAGDDLWVSGTLGEGLLGLRARRGELDAPEEAKALLVDRYRRPRPRLKLGVALRGLASACLDVSDGLLADLGHLCEASGVGAEVLRDAVPLDPRFRDLPGAVDAALGGGDDYELVFAAPADRRAEVEGVGREVRLPLARIGRLIQGEGIRLLDAEGRALPPPSAGWRHF